MSNMSFAGFVAGVAGAHQAASGALYNVETVIRGLKAVRHHLVFRTHGAFLRQLADVCRRDDINGIRTALEGYTEHLPAGWFENGRLKPAVLLGCRLIDDDQRNIVWTIIKRS